jgi:hypothetical protein
MVNATYTWDQLKEKHGETLDLDLTDTGNIVKVDNRYFYYDIIKAKVHYIASSPTLYIHFFRLDENGKEKNCGSIGIMSFEKLYVNFKTCYFELQASR